MDGGEDGAGREWIFIMVMISPLWGNFVDKVFAGRWIFPLENKFGGHVSTMLSLACGREFVKGGGEGGEFGGEEGEGDEEGEGEGERRMR